MTRDEAKAFLVENAAHIRCGYMKGYLKGFNIKYWGNKEECTALQQALGGKVTFLEKPLQYLEGKQGSADHSWSLDWDAAKQLFKVLEPLLLKGDKYAKKKAFFGRRDLDGPEPKDAAE
jgi:hypothetical protein